MISLIISSTTDPWFLHSGKNTLNILYITWLT